MSKDYATRAAQLASAIAISENLIRDSKSFSPEQKQIMLTGLESMRRMMADAKPASKTVRSLAFIEQAVVQPWNETSNEDAEKFWQASASAGLDYVRRDVLRDVLSQKRIRDQPEYEVVVDTVDANEDSGKITAAEAAALRRMINAFKRPR
jgi:hypothetical protein